ncbi:hypothetical protein [Occultella gossypii]|uniref:LPXTG-motif cell wall anchor domain-containing protein n=1 Tax=Occultella gossypii TaxID=2800820 RepID=A0ABS7S369_9MICO|nr:hypothetical protein [Occultella gossypii]MBZ2194796.1 hypothetical protein [Occultella gossypii]
MYSSRVPGIGLTAGLAYTGMATGLYLLVALIAVVGGLLLLRAARMKRRAA